MKRDPRLRPLDYSLPDTAAKRHAALLRLSRATFAAAAHIDQQAMTWLEASGVLRRTPRAGDAPARHSGLR